MSNAAALAEVAKIKMQRRASLEACIVEIDKKAPHPFLAALRAEFRGVLSIWDAEEALAHTSASASPAAAKPVAPQANPKAKRHWLKTLLKA